MLSTTALAALAASPVWAQGASPLEAQRTFNIPAQSLASALTAFEQQSGIGVSVGAASTSEFSAPEVRGAMTGDEALRRLLAGTGLTYAKTDQASVVIGAAAPQANDGAIKLNAVRVEGASERFGDAPPESRGFKADYQTSTSKTPLAIKETPQAISVVTLDSMKARHASDVLSTLELAAGVTTGVSSGGGPFAGPSPRVAEQFSLRGQRLNGDRDVRIDGFAAGAQRNEFDLAAFERVEVIKGPSSLLYGQGSLGGFINLVRKKPQAEFGASLDVQAGSYDTYRVDADVTGALLPDESARGRMVAAYADAGSFMDDVDERKIVLAPSIEARVSENTRVLLEILYQKASSLPSLGVPLRLDGDKLEIPDIPRSFYFGVQSEDRSKTRESMVSLRIDHQITDKWLATLLLQGSDNARRGYADSYGYGINEFGDTGLYAASTLHDTETWSGELRIDGAFNAFGREHKLIAGFERNKRQQDSWGGYTYVGTASIYLDNFESAGTVRAKTLPITYDLTNASENTGAYVQLGLSLTDRIKLLGGARYDHAEQTNGDNLNNSSSEETFSKTTFRIGVTGDLTDNLTAFAAYGQSFNPVDASAASGAVLDPEEGEGYEAGLKGEWFDGAFGASVSAFQQELDNRPIPDPNNGPGQFFSISGGLQRTKGLELEMSGSPMQGLTVGGALTFLDAEYIDPRDPNYSLTPQETTNRQSALYVSYELQDGPLQGLGLGGTWVNVGKRYSIAGGQNVSVDGYDRLDFSGYYKLNPNLTFGVHVRNLLDDRYIERNNGPYAYGHYFGSPRAVMFTLNASLGGFAR